MERMSFWERGLELKMTGWGPIAD